MGEGSAVIVQRMVNEGKGKKSGVPSLGASAYRSSVARFAPPLLSKLPHQASRRLTRTACSGTDVSAHRAIAFLDPPANGPLTGMIGAI
jgi:hypothetical protein